MAHTAADETTTPAPDLLTHLGRNSQKSAGSVNLPMYFSSTILFESYAEFKAARDHRYEPGRLYYGRYGTPATFELEAMLARLEEGHGAVVVSSGLTAVTLALLAFVKTGQHILMSDSVYGPARHFCDFVLSRMGIETTYYDPSIGAGIESLVRPETAVIYMESPGSGTFEVQDVGAIAAVARSRNIVSIIDNTWATPLFFKPLRHGVDVSIHAGTKYLTGHSDAMIGAIITTERHYDTVRHMTLAVGDRSGPEEVFLTLRGLRTLDVRMARHQETGLALAEWLIRQPEVVRVLHPAFPSCPGHEIWKRDFQGASGLFAFRLKPCSERALEAFIDHMKLFSIGLSWGGYESLILPAEPNRSFPKHPDEKGPLVRIHAGLESPASLIADLEAGFGRLRSVVKNEMSDHV